MKENIAKYEEKAAMASTALDFLQFPFYRRYSYSSITVWFTLIDGYNF